MISASWERPGGNVPALCLRSASISAVPRCLGAVAQSPSLPEAQLAQLAWSPWASAWGPA